MAHMSTDRADLIRTAWGAGLQEFADLLRHKRADTLRLSQTAMAARLGVNQSTISRVERGARPRDKAVALAFAQAYHLSRAETQAWLELLFGSVLVPLAGGANGASGSWGEEIERAYTLLGRLADETRAHSPYNYFQPIPSETLQQASPAFDAELTAAIDWALADKHLLPRAHLLVELAAVLIHRLNEQGRYRQRLALALVAADAAEMLERRTVEGWLRSDAIPWTLMQQRRDPAGARRHLERGLALAQELRNGDMEALALAFLGRSFLLQRNLREAEPYVARALDASCTAAARLRVLWVAGELAAARGQTETAVAYYRQAEETDLAAGRGHHTTVTANMRLGAACLSLGEPAAARDALRALLADRQAPLSAVRLAQVQFDLAQVCKMEGDFDAARAYAREAAIALQAADEDLRFSRRIREFVAGLPRQ